MDKPYPTTIIDLTLKGRVPSKKNSRILSTKNNRLRSFPSGQYKAWHTEQSWCIARFKPSIPFDRDSKCIVKIRIFPPDNRAADLTNKAESIMDLLVDNNFIEDDNWFVVSNVYLHFGKVDKDNPRAEVQITPSL